MATRKTRNTKNTKNPKDARDWTVDFADGGIERTPLDQEVKESMRSYIDYALTERALPYIDGLKPVHRAVLWCMWETNAKSTSNYVKSAKIASDTIGAYHPHSQDAVYGAAAGLTRSEADDSRCGACKLNACLIDGRGNFGASFEDSPAAPRYCISAGQLISTDSGFVPIEDITDTQPNSDNAVSISVKSIDGKISAVHILFNCGLQDVYELKLANGMSLQATPNHPVMTQDADGSRKWKTMDELSIGERVLIDNDPRNAMFGHLDDADAAMSALRSVLNQRTAVLPPEFLQATRDVQLACLSILFAGKGTTSVASLQLARQLQIVITSNFGCLCSINEADDGSCHIKLDDGTFLPSEDGFSGYATSSVADVRPAAAQAVVFSPKVEDPSHSFSACGLLNHNTEQRLSQTGESCVKDTGSGAVFMNPTFDAKHTIPEVMPVRVPLLLMNGSNGLAYGYNVSWLPHNPAEAIRACIVRLDNPKCTIAEIKAVMPGPDFPSGGILLDKSEEGLDQAYDTGFGNVLLTSRYTITRNATRSRHYIDFYETPYGISRSGDNSIVEGITLFAQKHPEYGIMDVKNLSGYENECLIEVAVKSSLNPEVVAAALVSPSSGTKLTQTLSYRQSVVLGKFQAADTVDATGREGMLRLTSPKPCDIGVIGYIDAFIDFRYACVVNSCKFEKEKAEHRKHMIDGLLKALLDIDEVIAIVRKSQNADTAKNNLKKAFKLDDEQANYVLSIPLSRLTRSDKIQLEANCKKLDAEIKRLTKILSSKKNVLAEIKRQLEEELEKQKVARRTTIMSADGKKVVAKAGESREQLAMTKTIAVATTGKIVAGAGTADDDEPVSLADALTVEGQTCVYLSPDGKVCQTTAKKGPEHVQSLTDIDMKEILLLVFANGDSVRMRVHDLPGKPTLLAGECVGFMSLGQDGSLDGKLMALATDSGVVKILKCDTLTKADECPVMSLSGKSRLLVARPATDETFFVFVASNANLLKFPTSSVNPQGRTSSGVAGIKLIGDARIVHAAVAIDDDMVVSFTGQSIKQTLLSEFPAKGRGTQGVRCHKFLKGEDSIANAFVGKQPTGGAVELPAPSGRDASGTKADGLDKLVLSLG